MTAVLLAAEDVNVAQNVGFGIIVFAMIFAALKVVTTKNVVHAALWLVIVLGGIAAAVHPRRWPSSSPSRRCSCTSVP